MYENTVNALQGAIGAMYSGTTKVVRWLPRPDVGLVIEKPSRVSQDTVWAWVPFCSSGEIPKGAVGYSDNEGRHHHAYSMPGLRKGMPAFRVPVRTEADIHSLINYVLHLPPIRDLA